MTRRTVAPYQRDLDRCVAGGLDVSNGPDGEGWATAHCPAHTDEHASLRINVENDYAECMSHKCFGNGAQHGKRLRDVLDYLHDHGATKTPTATNGSKPKGNVEPVARYQYDDETGDVLYRIVRYEDADGNKDFVAERPVGAQGWAKGIKNIRHILFRLPELIKADPAAPVYVVEGEKDVLRLIDAGLIATCNPFGANKWESAYNEHLTGRRVVLLPDNDDVGRAHMQAVGESLYNTAAEIKIVALPDLPDKGDVSDWLDAGGTVTELGKLVRSTPPWQPEYMGVLASDVVPVTVPWLWKGRIPLARLTIVGGDGNIGKSAIMSDLVARVTTGIAWPHTHSDRQRAPGSAIIITCEDDAADTIVPRLNLQHADMGRVRIIDTKTYQHFSAERLERMILDMQKKHPGPVLVSLEPLGVFLPSHDPNKDLEVRKALAPLQGVAARTGAALVGIMHTNKRSTETNVLYRFGGSGAYIYAARYALVVGYDPNDPEPDPNDRRRVLAVAKGNLSRRAPSLVYYMRDPEPGRVEWGDDASDVQAEQLLQITKPSDSPKLDDAIILLREMLGDGPEAVNAIKAEASARDLGWRTVERAKVQLGLKSDWLPDKGYWEWRFRKQGETAK